MVARVGVREQIVTDAQALLGFHETAVIALEDCAGRNPLFFRRHGNGRSVRVRARNHQDPVTCQAVIPGDNIRRQVSPGQMAYV